VSTIIDPRKKPSRAHSPFELARQNPKGNIMITRRTILTGTLLLASLPTIPAWAEDKPAEIRIGTQKGGFFPAVRQRHSIEDAFRPLGIDIKWIDFQFGPPLLEAINAGSVDFGFVGDAPPIFAQAGGAAIRYVAAVKSDGNNQAIIVPKDSQIRTLADLRGKRIAFGKGSSAHNLLVAALDAHHEEVAKAQAEATGVDIEATRRFVNRSNYRVVPVDDEVIGSQQAVADRFARLGLIPKPVNVSDIVWKWAPSS
jgi:ABC-type nitrate/sulfonate/bicarbonate transport system substrate-binding protein